MQLKRGCSGAWIAASVAILDRIAKVASGRGEATIPGLFRFRRQTNAGMAFGLFRDSGAALTALTLLICLALAGWLLLRPDGQSRLTRTGLWMALGGGLGNLYDRFAYGFVIDFIEPLFVRFAVFNVADAFICVGLGLAALGLFLGERKERAHE